VANRFCTVPQKPKRDILANAWAILSRACDSAESFFVAFGTVRDARKAKGTPTDHEQDLLRAALIFAAAGLDSMIKQLVRDTLSRIIAKDVGAQAQFADYVQTRLARGGTLDIKYLAQALLADDTREHLKNELVRDLTGSSLQSKDQLLRVAAYFAIPADELTSDVSRLRDVFETRNQIAHEMDVQFKQPNRSRRSRTYDAMQDATALILKTATAFYSAVAKRL
jgi:hypothetical protein